MHTILGVSSVSRVTVWVNARDRNEDGNEISVDINMGGWQGERVVGIAGNMDDRWYGIAFDGSWGQTELDNLIVRIKLIDSGGNFSAFIRALYAEITYI